MPLSRRDALVSAGTLAGVGMIAGGAKATNVSSRGTPSTSVALTSMAWAPPGRMMAMASTGRTSIKEIDRSVIWD
jgi:hypothetical protein